MNGPDLFSVTSRMGFPISDPGPFGAGASKKPSFTTDQAAKQITRENHRFRDRNGDQKIDLHYTVDASFTAQQKQRVHQAVQAWQDVANISFREQSNGTDGALSIHNNPRGDRGVADLPHGSTNRTAATIGTRGGAASPALGSHFSVTAIHEIGHAIGLQHPGRYNGDGANYQNGAVYAQDTKARTVMSYWSERHQSGHDFRSLNPSAPMMDDIAAAQRLYGANHQTRKTDTVYGFNSNTEREVMSLTSARDKPVFCVWDGGGVDTLDFSGFSQDQKVDLNAESFSDVGGLKGNVSVAKGCVIENAIGGAGRDALIGNDAANRLKGGAGADTLRGGGGADTFVYDNVSDSAAQSPDLIEDFTSGTDKIDVSGALKAAGVRALVFTDRFSGRAGEAVLKHDASTGGASLAIDLKGTGNADMVINSKGQIKPGDVRWDGSQPEVQSVPTPAPTPTPAPAPTPTPTPPPGETPNGPSALIEMLAKTLSAFVLQLLQIIAPSSSGRPRS